MNGLVVLQGEREGANERVKGEAEREGARWEGKKGDEGEGGGGEGREGGWKKRGGRPFISKYSREDVKNSTMISAE